MRGLVETPGGGRLPLGFRMLGFKFFVFKFYQICILKIFFCPELIKKRLVRGGIVILCSETFCDYLGFVNPGFKEFLWNFAFV